MRICFSILLLISSAACMVTEPGRLRTRQIHLPEEPFIARFEQALAMVETRPYDPDLRMFLGKYYLYRMHQPRKALMHFIALAQIKPRSANAHFNVAAANLYLKDHDSAAKSFKTALDCDPDHAQSCYSLAMLYRERKPRLAAIYLKRWEILKYGKPRQSEIIPGRKKETPR